MLPRRFCALQRQPLFISSTLLHTLQARVREVELEDVRNAYQGLATEHRRLQANVMQVCGMSV